MRKLLATMAAMLLTVAGLSACTAKAKQVSNEVNETEETNKEVMDLKGKKVLVAYFSWSGNTKYAAQYIAKKVGADEFEIIREKPYPTEYTPCTVSLSLFTTWRIIVPFFI